MNGTDSRTEHDMGDFDDVRRLYRQEATSIEPPAALDDAILAASRRAVQAGPVPVVARRGRWPWQAPLAAAAVVVLATSLAVLFFDQGGQPPDRGVPPARQTAALQAPSAPDGGTGGQDATAKPPAAATAGADDSKRPTVAADAGSAPVVAMTRSAPDVADAKRGGTAQARPQVVPDPAADRAPASVFGEAERAKAEASDRVEDLVTAARRAKSENAAVAQGSAPDGAAAPGSSAAKASAASPSAASPPAAMRDAPVPAAPAAAEAVARPAASAERLSPERRLQDIRRLWESGQREEAARRFEAFLQDHPAFPVPADFPVPRPPPR